MNNYKGGNMLFRYTKIIPIDDEKEELKCLNNCPDCQFSKRCNNELQNRIKFTQFSGKCFMLEDRSFFPVSIVNFATTISVLEICLQEQIQQMFLKFFLNSMPQEIKNLFEETNHMTHCALMQMGAKIASVLRSVCISSKRCERDCYYLDICMSSKKRF